MVERANSRMKGAEQIDKELKAAYSLKDQLESELTKQETMSERVVVRKDCIRDSSKRSEKASKKSVTTHDALLYAETIQSGVRP